MENRDRYHEIVIQGPTNMTVFGMLLQAVGTMWPGAHIGTPSGFMKQTSTVLLIPKEEVDARGPITAEEAESIRAAAPHDLPEAEINSMGPDGVSMKTPDELSLALAGLCVPLLKSAPGCNYMTCSVHDPETGEAFEIVTQKIDKPTPHQKRIEAEARLGAAEGMLREVLDASIPEDLRAKIEGVLLAVAPEK